MIIIMIIIIINNKAKVVTSAYLSAFFKKEAGYVIPSMSCYPRNG